MWLWIALGVVALIVAAVLAIPMILGVNIILEIRDRWF